MNKSNVSFSQTSGSRPAALRDKIIDAASRALIEDGYENLSLRQLASEVGCSQMAMYRYFSNKDALVQYLCVELYTRFTEKMHRRMGEVEDLWEKIRIFIAELIRFAVSYPDHYSLIFLVRHKDRDITEQRDRLGKEFLQGIRQIVQGVLPAGSQKELVDTRLRQIVTCVHGVAALLISHPRAYTLTRERAIRDTEEAVAHVLGITE